MNPNATNLRLSIQWLAQMVAGRLSMHLGKAERLEVDAFSYQEDDSWIAGFLEREQPDVKEFAIFILALVPHVDPALLGGLIHTHLPDGGDLAEFGGSRGANHRGVIPTGETAQFILCGSDLGRRLEVQGMLAADHWLARKRILWLEPVREGEPAMSGRLIVNPEIVEEIVTGHIGRPAFSIDFPAEHIETSMDWDDLVLNPMTRAQIREIENWIKHSDTLMNDWACASASSRAIARCSTVRRVPARR